MGDKSEIQWTDATWNPTIGCSKVSPGCAHCYAEELHRTRLAGVGAYPPYKPWTPENADHNVRLVPERLDQPIRWSKPRMIFVNSMSDLFHENVPDYYIADCFAVMALASHHKYQVLTKRPERMAELLVSVGFWVMVANAIAKRGSWASLSGEQVILPHVWLGTSIENRRFVGRADALRATPAAVRFISAEPLLGPLVARFDSEGELGEWVWPDGRVSDGEDVLDLAEIDWLIVGGESGRGHRPIKESWVLDLRDAAVSSGTAFFFKQWGGRTPKAGGRLLEGREWDEMPA